ncbi:thiamine pyrophosphate-dependent enzyme [Ideonella azotifigens]|uniref:Thiamine pyrophosphate enzyme TPP-binding domain-containing protein n=1 Tax=Ideonella azotifigens TaxID=513160 RepID=A0ABN1KKL7_9BURK
MPQEREYPGRVSGTQLVNPDFVAFAQAFVAHAERIEHEVDFPAAFARAKASGKAAMIELVTDRLQLGPQSRMKIACCRHNCLAEKVSQAPGSPLS